MNAPRSLALWHLASLDAPSVAVVWALAFAWAAKILLPLWVPLLLALVTWSVYVGDRLLDAHAGLRNPARRVLRERHKFHWRFRRILLPLAAGAAIASAAIVLVLMPMMARERDSVLAGAALAYFSGVHSWRGTQQAALKWARRLLSKEFLVGVLFTTGCILPAWPRMHNSGPAQSSLWPFWIPGVYFAALAWLNCSCIAEWESEDPGRAARFGEASGKLFRSRQNPSMRFFAAALLALAGGWLAIFAYSWHLRAAALLATGVVSALLLAVLDRARMRFSPLALRACADLVLLTPMVLFLR